MSTKEVQRAFILKDVKSGEIKLTKASELLGLSYSQAKRIWSNYKKQGPKGLISKKRGKRSNRSVPQKIRKKIAKIIIDHYQGCSPLFTSEKLVERHQLKYSSEFIRQLMIEYKLWIPKQSKRKVHQRRLRRECEGELVQMDASDHEWFEDRGPRCHLHLLVDDATTKIFSGHFTLEETTQGYFRACFSHFEERGLPLSFYCDRRGTFKVNQGTQKGETQFSRAMKELGIKMIFALSPQAKGRIERVFGVLQERLIWEMRIRNISTIEEANKFLPDFFKVYNQKFAKEPTNTFDAHRQYDHNLPLKYILCTKDSRRVTKNLEIQYHNTTYQLDGEANLRTKLSGSQINVLKTLEGEMQFEFQGELLNFKKYDEISYVRPNAIQAKNWKTHRRRKSSKYHPWR